MRASYAGLPPSAFHSPRLLPDPLPPRSQVGGWRIHVHRAPDVGDVPARQRRQILRLAFVSLWEFRAIANRCVAGTLAGPGMAEHISTLEIRAVRGFLKDQVLGEVSRVVPHV